MVVIYCDFKKLNKLMNHGNKSNKIKIGVNEMTVNDSKMCVR